LIWKATKSKATDENKTAIDCIWHINSEAVKYLMDSAENAMNARARWSTARIDS
jgi:hypothetical protein